jgi:hypothetical protein
MNSSNDEFRYDQSDAVRRFTSFSRRSFSLQNNQVASRVIDNESMITTFLPRLALVFASLGDPSWSK